MCDAKIRPMRPAAEVEVQCELPGDDHAQHSAIIRDYAYEGSQTVIQWLENDRRTFRGTWQQCPNKHRPDMTQCILPNRHRGDHAR